MNPPDLIANRIIELFRPDSYDAEEEGKLKSMEKNIDVYQDYGWENGWKEIPQTIRLCRKKEHHKLRNGSFSDVDIGPPMRGIHHVVRCHICKIIYHYDSSD